MQINFPVLLISALITMPMGFIWYHPRVFGSAWMKASGVTDEMIKSSNLLRILILTYLFTVMIAFVLQFMVIHQFSLYSVVADSTTPEAKAWLESSMAQYGDNFRTFRHGALHGFLCGLFFALPLVGVNALFERRSARYILIHGGYWILTLLLMGGIICRFA